MVKQPDFVAKEEAKLWDADINADGWYIYKVAYSGRNGTTSELLKFMADYSGGTDCEAVNLGCDGYKLTCNYGMKQLHYVVAPTLPSEAVDGDQLGVDGWVDIAMESFGDMSTFSAFMHDKVQLWTTGVRTKAEELEAGGYKTMRRMSTASDGKTKVGHVLTPVGGKIWEFVGVLSPEEAKTAGFTAWAKEECPKAHEVDAVNLDVLKRFGKDTSGATNWIAVTTGVGTSSDDTSLNAYTSTLVDMTGALKSSYKDDYCEVTSFNYLDKWEDEAGGASGENVFFKLVHNYNYQDISVSGVRGGLDVDSSISGYQDYVGKVHERFLSLPADGDSDHRWRGWDHYLDQHIGIKYSGDSAVDSTDVVEADTMQDLCLTQATKMNERFLADKTWVGKRFIQTDGDHYYTGYSSSSMALEFNTECHYGQEGATDICTCVPQNSDTLALELYGTKYATCALIYEEEDGHTDTSGPWDGDAWQGNPSAVGPAPTDSSSSSSSATHAEGSEPPATPPAGPSMGGTAQAAGKTGAEQYNGGS